MAIPAIASALPVAPALPTPISGLEAGTPAPGFGEALGRGLQQVSALEHTADALVEDVASGGSTRIHEVMAATSQAGLAVDMLVQVRDRALEAYQEVMRIQV
ncbi:flagellar hook-basal body complex protein FliE [Egicoccus halophilus]|uniref:Flagellar hook-basal body complex protein FliE n=1 Tax=Egicoccus halophilus TaxID=1670830 RepID=A0A8J3A8B3_9ACTN|nr:flagellar hook-basal body complex protein FliE [Egicoccus halophilus]GGI06687.1 flagellar hook-basal body complex protein FliE [Egicoccus halophilus]